MLFAEIGDVGPGRLEDAQAKEPEHGDQRDAGDSKDAEGSFQATRQLGGYARLSMLAGWPLRNTDVPAERLRAQHPEPARADHLVRNRR